MQEELEVLLTLKKQRIVHSKIHLLLFRRLFFVQGTTVGRLFQRTWYPKSCCNNMVCDYMCTHPVNDNFWIIPSMRLLIHRRYDLGGRDLGPWGRFWHSDACVCAVGFDCICLHEDLKRTCHWLGVTRKHDASYESVKRTCKYIYIYKLYASATHGCMCSLFCGVISIVAQLVLNAQRTRSGKQENSATPGSAETCPTEGQRHLAHGTPSGVPARVFPRVEFVRDSWLTFGIIYFDCLRFVAVDSES